MAWWLGVKAVLVGWARLVDWLVGSVSRMCTVVRFVNWDILCSVAIGGNQHFTLFIILKSPEPSGGGRDMHVIRGFRITLDCLLCYDTPTCR